MFKNWLGINERNLKRRGVKCRVEFRSFILAVIQFNSIGHLHDGVILLLRPEFS